MALFSPAASNPYALRAIVNEKESEWGSVYGALTLGREEVAGIGDRIA